MLSMPFSDRIGAILALAFLAGCGIIRGRKTPMPMPIEKEEHVPGAVRIGYETLSVRIPIHSVQTYTDTLRLAGAKLYVRYDTLYKTLYMQQIIPREVTRTDTVRQVVYIPEIRPQPEPELWKPPLWAIILASLGIGLTLAVLARFLIRV